MCANKASSFHDYSILDWALRTKDALGFLKEKAGATVAVERWLDRVTVIMRFAGYGFVVWNEFLLAEGFERRGRLYIERLWFKDLDRCEVRSMEEYMAKMGKAGVNLHHLIAMRKVGCNGLIEYGYKSGRTWLDVDKVAKWFMANWAGG